MAVLNCSVEEIVRVVGGVTAVDHERFLKNITSLEQAGPEDLAVLLDPDKNAVFGVLPKNALAVSRAGLILVSKKVAADKNYLIVDDPLEAMGKIFAHIRANLRQESGLRPEYPHAAVSCGASIGSNVIINPGVVVQHDAILHDDVVLGAQSYVGYGAELKTGVHIGPGVRILDRTVIGAQSRIQAGAVLGATGFGYRATATGLKRVPHFGNVVLGSWVEIGANATVDRAVFDSTIVGDGVKIGNGAQIAHNVKVGSHTAILTQTVIGGSTIIGQQCLIGAMVAIKDHVTIGNKVSIVSQAGVLRDLPDGAVVAGSPSMAFMDWKRLAILLPQLPKFMRSCERNQGRKTWWQRIRSLMSQVS